MTVEEFEELRELNNRIEALEASIRDLKNECNKIILGTRKENDHE